MPAGHIAHTDHGPGEIDYRLSRHQVLDMFRSGDLSRHEVCDAQRELRRNAAHCGVDSGEVCPICEDAELRNVTYVFGPRLPSHGRCVSTQGELERIRKRKGSFTGYVVEVCCGCGWNHLVRSYALA